MMKGGRIWRHTKHGRKRFIERICLMTDYKMLKSAYEESIFGFFKCFNIIWEDDYKDCRNQRLVTVYYDDATVRLDALLYLMDRPSEFTFDFSNFTRRLNNGR